MRRELSDSPSVSRIEYKSNKSNQIEHMMFALRKKLNYFSPYAEEGLPNEEK
jgi:hypothetical protein